MINLLELAKLWIALFRCGWLFLMNEFGFKPATSQGYNGITGLSQKEQDMYVHILFFIFYRNNCKKEQYTTMVYWAPG